MEHLRGHGRPERHGPVRPDRPRHREGMDPWLRVRSPRHRVRLRVHRKGLQLGMLRWRLWVWMWLQLSVRLLGVGLRRNRRLRRLRRGAWLQKRRCGVHMRVHGDR